MSIAENPLVGRMRKSMANFTTYTLNGKNIIRSKPFRVRDARSVKQLIMRARMKEMANLYNYFSKIIVMGFSENMLPKSPENIYPKPPQNLFVKANFSFAFEVIENMPVVRYPWLLLSKGSLPEAKVLDAVINDQGILIRYDAGLLPDVLFATDEIVACARLITGELLMAKQFIGYDDFGTILLKYPAMQAEDVMCCYVFVRSGDGKKSSNSVYVEVKG